MKTISALVAVATVSVVLLFSTALLAADRPDLAGGVKITAPDPSLPDNIRAFFGVDGIWKGEMRRGRSRTQSTVVLIFKTISSDQAEVFCDVDGRHDDNIARFQVDDSSTRVVIPSGKGDWSLHLQGKDLVGNIGSFPVVLQQGK